MAIPISDSVKGQDYIQVTDGSNPVNTFRVSLDTIRAWLNREGRPKPMLSMQNTKAEIMAYMDEKQIEYNSGDTKEDLLQKAGV